MKKARIALFHLLLLAALLFMCTGAAATERNIYVGDIIELKITSQGLTESFLREKFADFEIVELDEKKDHFIIKLRTFETGEKRVVLRDKEIVIIVKSTLDEIQSEGPMEGDMKPAATGFDAPWLYLFCAVLLVFITTGIIYFVRLGGRKEKVQLTPYQRFLSQSGSLPVEDEEYFVKLTRHFKDYLEAVYKCKIIYKTSYEILQVTDGLPHMRGMRKELCSWLEESDFFKFTGAEASDEQKREMHKKLAELVGRIEAEKGAAS